jgi:hypothetical protein
LTEPLLRAQAVRREQGARVTEAPVYFNVYTITSRRPNRMAAS